VARLFLLGHECSFSNVHREKNYDCHLTDEIQANAKMVVEKAKEKNH
jgi:hypothetical protein